MDEVPMLWTVTLMVYGAVHHSADREQRLMHHSGKAARPLDASLSMLRGALVVYTLGATVLYFFSGFLVFIVMFSLSVLALTSLAFGAVMRAQPPVGSQARRLLVCAALAYGGGALLLWLPGELFCERQPLLKQLHLHALFHITSAAGPHLGLTAFALTRHSDEQPAARSRVWLAGMPAIDRTSALHKRV